MSLPPGGGTTADPWRVWIVGDSVINDGSPGITAALQATGNAQVVLDTSFGGWGLTTAHQWPSDAEQAIAANHPQIVIGTWAWDDGLAQQAPATYEQLLRSYLSVLLRPGDGVDLVVLVQFPTPGPSSTILDPIQQHAQWAQTLAAQDAWDREAAQAVQAFPGQAVYLQTASVFSPGGRFFAWMRDAAGQWIRARKVDNAHMCPYGAAEFGALLVGELTPMLHLGPMAPGWDTGAWVDDPRYNDPPGACPDDQPPAGYNGVPVPAIPTAGTGSG